jgi:hypothetical protein
MSNDTPGPLLKELDKIYQDINKKLEKASFFGKSVADKIVPIETILLFVGKVVRKVEDFESENKFLQDELARVNLELARQNTLLLHIDGIGEAIKKMESDNEGN